MPTNNSTILAACALVASNDYQQRVPDVTQAGVQAVSKFLCDPMNRQYFNQFVSIFINRVGGQHVHNKRYENKFKVFKKPNMPYGSTIQEIAPAWIKAHSYDDAAETLLKLHRPDAAVWYHTIDRADMYPISINDIELRRAFVDEFGLNSVVSTILEAPRNSDEYDEFLIFKNLIKVYEDNWGFFKVNVTAPTTVATAQDFLTIVRTYAGLFEFPSMTYSAAAAAGYVEIPTFAKPEELVLITTPNVIANIDVKALAGAFNRSDAEIKYRIVTVDQMPVAGAIAILTTEDFFVCCDTVYETTTFWNPQTLTTNYYLHHQGVYSVSPFVPAVLFTTGSASSNVTCTFTPSTYSFGLVHDGSGVAVTTATEKLAIGETYRFHGALTGSLAMSDSSDVPTSIDVAPNAAVYTFKNDSGPVDGATSFTHIDQLTGKLYIGEDWTRYTTMEGEVGSEVGTIQIVGDCTYYDPDGTASVSNVTVNFLAPDDLD